MKLSKARQSIIAIAAGFLLIAWIKHSFALLAGAILIAATFPFPFLNIPIHNAWMFLSKILGTISSHIILFIIFYFFLTPLSFIRKIIRQRDSMKNFHGNMDSSLSIKNHEYQKKDFINPW